MTSFSGSVSRPYTYPRDPFRLSVGENVGHEARYYSNTAFNLLFEKRLMSPVHPVNSPINIYVNKASGLYYNIEPTINGSGYEVGDISYTDYIEDMRGLLEDIAWLHVNDSSLTYDQVFSTHMNRVRAPYDLDNSSASGKALTQYVNTSPLGQDIDMDELLWNPFCRLANRAYVRPDYYLVSPIFPAVVKPDGQFQNYNQSVLDYLDDLGINSVSSGAFLCIGDNLADSILSISSGSLLSPEYQMPFASGVSGELEVTYIYSNPEKGGNLELKTKLLMSSAGQSYLGDYYTLDSFENIKAALYLKPSGFALSSGVYLLNTSTSGNFLNIGDYPGIYGSPDGYYTRDDFGKTEHPGLIVDTKCIFNHGTIYDGDIGRWPGNNRFNGLISTFTDTAPAANALTSAVIAGGFPTGFLYIAPIYQTNSGIVSFYSFEFQGFPTGNYAATLHVADASFTNFDIAIEYTQHNDTRPRGLSQDDLNIYYWERPPYYGYNSYPAVSLTWIFGTFVPEPGGLTVYLQSLTGGGDRFTGEGSFNVDGYIAIGEPLSNNIITSTVEVDMEGYEYGVRLEEIPGYTITGTTKYYINISGIENGFAYLNDTFSDLDLCTVNGEPHLQVKRNLGIEAGSGLYHLDAASIAAIPSHIRTAPRTLRGASFAGSGYLYDVAAFTQTDGLDPRYTVIARYNQGSFSRPTAMFGVDGYPDSFPRYNITFTSDIQQILDTNNLVVVDFSKPIWDAELGCNYLYIRARSAEIEAVIFFCKMNTSYEIYEAIFLGGSIDVSVLGDTRSSGILPNQAYGIPPFDFIEARPTTNNAVILSI